MVGPPSRRMTTGRMSMPKGPTPAPSPLSSPPPEAWQPLVALLRIAGRPLERFLRIEAASGILLLVAAMLALVCANSPWAETYLRFWQLPLGIRVGGFTFQRSLEWFVNDGLMVIFFFVVGMEIRREIHEGELSEWRRAALPAAAALGGMLVPAAVYLALAGGVSTRSGWGVPMATDIAFALGILTLLGRRVPAALRVLLLALAVIDDLGAIVVIALFYSSGIAVKGLLGAGLAFAAVFAMQRLGIRSKAAYILPAGAAWAGIYAAGIHPTIAGVLVGLMTPVRTWLGPEGFAAQVRPQLAELSETPAHSADMAENLRLVDRARREALSPAESLIQMLHPWVAFGIMPVFALANAGVSISSGSLDAASWTVVSGVAAGLLLGKPLGILAACWLTLRLGIGTLPRGMTVRHLLVLGVVAGVGFTMALFIAQLAFTEARLLAAAKLGVLAASGAAATLALVLGRLMLPSAHASGAAETADEAERSTET
jgi:Na+:H+ antiporter, NhaA family